MRRSEMMFINGTALDQVLSYSELQAERFYIDEREQTIYIQPPEAINVDHSVVEIALRPTLFSVFGKTNIVLEGIIFRYGNTALDGQAVRFDGSANILVEECQFRWNNWVAGFQAFAEYISPKKYCEPQWRSRNRNLEDEHVGV